jgi:hypothetical protein
MGLAASTAPAGVLWHQVSLAAAGSGGCDSQGAPNEAVCSMLKARAAIATHARSHAEDMRRQDMGAWTQQQQQQQQQPGRAPVRPVVRPYVRPHVVQQLILGPGPPGAPVAQQRRCAPHAEDDVGHHASLVPARVEAAAGDLGGHEDGVGVGVSLRRRGGGVGGSQAKSVSGCAPWWSYYYWGRAARMMTNTQMTGPWVPCHPHRSSPPSASSTSPAGPPPPPASTSPHPLGVARTVGGRRKMINHIPQAAPRSGAKATTAACAAPPPPHTHTHTCSSFFTMPMPMTPLPQPMPPR